MAAILLHIKGTKKNATRAAARRGIPVKSCRKNMSGTVNCAATCASYARIVRWFGEKSGQVRQGRGFAPGTLLYYSGSCR
jgi:hypothetical protein